MGVAVLLMATGVVLLSANRYAARIGQASLSWPSAWGTVIRSEVRDNSDSAPKHAFEAVTPDGGVRCFTVHLGPAPRSAATLAAKYPVGTPVLIYYEPSRREGYQRFAVIEPGERPLGPVRRRLFLAVVWGYIVAGAVVGVVEVL